MKLYPTILSDSLATVRKQASQANSLEKIETLQIDVIDGYYADNVTVTPLDLVEVDFGKLSVDLHLMTEEPLDYVYEFLERKDMIPIRGIMGQIEKMSYQRFFLEEVKKHGWKAGLSLDVFTPIEEIDEEVWPLLDIVQLVAVEIGFQGGDFHSSVLQKIEKLKKIIDQVENADFGQKKSIEIIIDGGVKVDTIKSIRDAGADGVAVGSALWEAGNVEQMVTALLEASNNA